VKIGLVGCVKSKLDHPAAAKDLYISDLFVGRRRYVERSCDQWFILSALHGLVRPSEVLNPYDLSLKSCGADERRAWSKRVLGQIQQQLGPIAGMKFEAHAGSEYLDFGLIEGLRAARGKSRFQPTVFHWDDNCSSIPDTPSLAIRTGIPAGDVTDRAKPATRDRVKTGHLSGC